MPKPFSCNPDKIPPLLYSLLLYLFLKNLVEPKGFKMFCSLYWYCGTTLYWGCVLWPGLHDTRLPSHEDDLLSPPELTLAHYPCGCFSNNQALSIPPMPCTTVMWMALSSLLNSDQLDGSTLHVLKTLLRRLCTSSKCALECSMCMTAMIDRGHHCYWCLLSQPEAFWAGLGTLLFCQ